MSELQNENIADRHPLSVRKIRKNSLRREIGADFVLPDYMGDVKRLLKYTATVTPINTLISDGEVSFMSVLTFKVIYLDGDDLLTEASFTADAEFSERTALVCSSASADYKVQAVSVRLAGPRKMSAKATLTCEAALLEECEVCSTNAYEGAESLKREIKIHTQEYLKCAEREYAEEIDKIAETVADDFEIVKSSAVAFIDAVHRTEGGVNLSGYVDAFVILRSEDGMQRLEKRIPIEEHVECEEKDGGAFIPEAHVSSVVVNLNNVSGENECAVSVVMNMTVECSVLHHYGESYTVVTDAFYEGCKNKCAYEDLEYNELSDCIFEKSQLLLTVQRTEEPLYDIIESEMYLKNPRCEIVGSEATVTSDVELHLVARGTGAESCYSIKEKGEFKKKLRLGSANVDKTEVNAIPCEVSVSFDGDKIYVESQILVSLITEARKSERVLSDIVFESEGERDECSIIVYYPDADDTLWSVSKKYGVSMDKISKANGIRNDSIDGLSRIMIIK